MSGCKKTVAWRSPSSGEREEVVDIPAGVDTGMNLRLQGKGETGKGGNGTLYVVINVRDHPVFERDGNDVHVKVPPRTLSLALALSLSLSLSLALSLSLGLSLSLSLSLTPR